MTENIIPSKISYSKAVDIKRLDFIAKSIELHTSGESKVLDVGCGNGLISMQLGQLGYNVKGIDISEKAISKAKAKNTLPNVSFEVADAEELSIQNQKYDVVICSEVLEHLHEPGNMLETLRELIAEKGILIVTVPNGRGPREVLITKPMQWMQSKAPFVWGMVRKGKGLLGYDGKTEQSDADDLTHIHFFTKRNLKDLSKEKGFELLTFGKANFVGDVFPFSFFIKRSLKLQQLDCKTADLLPHYFTCGFNTVWAKK
ncbi:class I SAM-dependent methyltransferase [Flexithrix dorotheae]|uniref:class I SAM-dependent methyltransferase n=1 Tax=Flexithrix dorotheae TaxID=70993 RepID=UPI00035E39AD|nr:methyltransferase domain-containing protein [Flexithrix dorotheae]